MTLCDLARQWFTSTKFASYDEMKKKFTQEYSEYGKTLMRMVEVLDRP